MGHQSWLYGKTDQIIYKTDGYSGTYSDVDDTERFTDDIDLTKETGCHIDFTLDGSDATDDLVIRLYKRRDDNWTGNEILWPDGAITVSNNGVEAVYVYTIPEEYQAGHYRFGLQSSGATTTFEIEAAARMWRKTKTRA